jgi:hypothetical protein
MSSPNQWKGNLWSTSFNLVIFSEGEIFKKTIGPDGKSAWAKIVFEEGALNWSYCDWCPGPSLGSECANIHSLWWNIVPIKGEPTNRGQEGSHSLCFFVGPEEDCWAWSCQYKDSNSTCMWSTPNWSPCYLEDNPELCNLYRGSVPLTELGTLQRVDNCSDNEEKRYDPYDHEGGHYSKKEFLNYYGSTLEWDMVSPEKVLRRQMIGEVIATNNRFLSHKSVNHLLDKYLETFL